MKQIILPVAVLLIIKLVVGYSFEWYESLGFFFLWNVGVVLYELKQE